MQKKPEANNHDQYFRTEHLTDGIGERTARGGLVTLAFHGGKFAISIVATMILAHLLTPEDYGLIGMVAVISNFASIFRDGGLSTATIQKPEIVHDQINALFWVNFGLSFVFMALVMAIAPAVAWFYGEPRLADITTVTAIGFLIGGLAVQHEALLNRQMRFFALGGIAFTAMTLGYAVGITFAWYGFHYWALVFGQLTLLATSTVGAWLACRWRPCAPKRSKGVKSMLKFGVGVTGYATINYLSRNIDNLLIGQFMGAQQLGFYSKATQLVGLPTDQINGPLGVVAMPVLSRLSEDPKRYRQAYLRIMEKVILLIMPLIALMIVSADWMVYLMLGPQWEMASPIFVCLAISGLFQPVINSVGWLLPTQGRSYDMIKWSMINAPISIISIIVGLHWGAIGVAASYSLARLFIANPLTYWFLGRSGPVRTMDFYRLLAPFVTASGAGIAACYIYKQYVAIDNPVIGITCNFILLGSVNLLVLCLLPRGRSALLDMKNLLSIIKTSKTYL